MTTATPPLGRRIVLVGISVVVVVLVLVDVFLYVALRVGLSRALDEVLTDRAAIAQFEATQVPSDELAGQLQERGLAAVVRTADGAEFRSDPASPQMMNNLPPVIGDTTAVSRTVPLPDGGEVQVFARTSGTSRTLQQLVLLEIVGSLAAVALAAVLLTRTSRTVLRPLRVITSAAQRTTRGHEGQRLRPDRPDTELGTMAAAYDAMLDQLETALADATAARKTSALLAAVVEDSADAVIAEDHEGRIISWNRYARTLYGYTAEEAIGRPGSMLVPAHCAAETDELLRTVREGHTVSGHETQRLTRDGTVVDVSVTLSPVRDDEGHVIATSSIGRDLTVQRRMTRELNEALTALQEAVDETRRSQASTQRFLADAAHQLRTPIAGIRACAETLLRGASPADADRLLAIMVRETARAGRLVSALIQMARLDHGETLAPSEVDLVDVCAGEVDRVDLLAPDLRVELHAAEEAHGRWRLDAPAMREIVSNLLDNARRHAETGIDLTIDKVGGQLMVRVVNDGPVIAEEDRTRVFERFVSLDGRGGSGLGLPIARGLARAMGGDLHYDGGFVLTLPAVPDVSESRRPEPAY